MFEFVLYVYGTGTRLVHLVGFGGVLYRCGVGAGGGLLVEERGWEGGGRGGREWKWGDACERFLLMSGWLGRGFYYAFFCAFFLFFLSSSKENTRGFLMLNLLLLSIRP